jgi:hypothetical protein
MWSADRSATTWRGWAGPGAVVGARSCGAGRGAQRWARSVALRDAVRDGWDADAVAQALLTLREPTLS